MVARVISSLVIRGSQRPCRPTRWCHHQFNPAAAVFYSTTTPSHNNLQLKDPPPPVIETPSPPSPPVNDDNEDLGIFTAANMSMGQVIFLGSPASGAVLYTSLALGDPKLSLYAALGTITANTTSKMLGLDKSMYNTGLWGYNGALIGCAASVFGPAAYYPYTLLTTVLGAAATPIVCATLKSTVHASSPQWTWSFNIVALSSLLIQQHKLLQPVASTTMTTTTTSGFDNIQTYISTIHDAGTAHLTTYIHPILLSPLTGISQIFVVNSPFTGLGIVAGTALYSPMLAVHALGGASMGCLVGYASGADITAMTEGLWGYNSALASMAVGVFYVNNTPSTIVLSAVSAAGAAALFGLLGPIFDTHGGVPCLTVPFCTVASATYLLGKGGIPGLKHAKDPHSPEKNGV